MAVEKFSPNRQWQIETLPQVLHNTSERGEFCDFDSKQLVEKHRKTLDLYG